MPDSNPFNIPLPVDDDLVIPEEQKVGLDDQELLALLQREEESSGSYRNSSLADEQANALDFYDARPFGDEVEGQSQVITPDVAETVDYMTISVARQFVSGDYVVEFDARLPGQEDQAQEATEAVTQSFMHDQDGYKVIIDWLQSGLIEKIGVVKTTCIMERRVLRSTVQVDQEQLAALHAGLFPDMQLVDVQTNPDGMFMAKTQKVLQHKRYADFPVPSEEFLFSMRARHEDDTQYIAQRSRKTRSDLVEMGFARDVIDNLPVDSDAPWWSDVRSEARWGADYTLDRDEDANEVVLLEEYVRADRDGDGIAELLKVFRVADTILEVEEVDEQPFVVFCPFPRAHRMVGDSLAEKVMDIQRIRSVTTRQTIDGMMLTNRPRSWIDETTITESTIDDWLTSGPGVLVRTRGGAGPQPIGDNFDTSQGLAMLQFLSGEKESRTGITRLNQGLDADTLNKTATGTALMQAQGQQMEEYVARNAASAFGRLFAKKARLMIAEGDPIMVKIDGAFKQANPADWDGEMPVKVRVGLGTGSKDKRLGYWQTLGEALTGLKQQGSPIVTDENLYRVLSGGIRDMGLGNPSQFVTDPSTIPPQPPQPSADVVKAQADAQTQQAKDAQSHQQTMAKLQLQQQQQQASATLQQQAAQQELQIKSAAAQQAHDLRTAEAEQAAQLANARAAEEARLAQEKQAFDMAQARELQDFNMEQARKKANSQADGSDQVSGFRPGGDLSE